MAKQRLAAHLSEDQRTELARALAWDALDLSGRCAFLDWWVVSDDPAIRSEARERGFRVVGDPGTGLNAALARGIRAVVEAGASSVTILPADLPLATADDVRDIVDTLATSTMVVVPSGGDGGTNALALSPPDVVEPRFGPGSLEAHVALASERNLRCSVLALDRLALDLDTRADIDGLLAAEWSGGRAYAICARLAAGG